MNQPADSANPTASSDHRRLPESDVLIIGAGLLGLAVARALTRFAPGIAITILEQHPTVPGTPSGRRAGVIHSGIFNPPGTQRAHVARAGRSALQRFARETSLPMERCGKLLVAATTDQRDRLADLAANADALGVRAQRLDAAGIRDREPAVAGIAGLWLEDAGIIDYRAVTQALAEDVRLAGARFITGARVADVEPPPAGSTGPSLIAVTTADGDRFTARGLIACCGRSSDHMARLAGVETDVRVATFRSEYHQLRESASSLCRHLIYPVPGADATSIGVHLARRLDGRVECGPGAVLAVDPDQALDDPNDGRLASAISLRGVRRRIGRRWRGGVADVRPTCSRRTLLRELQGLVPAIGLDDLEPAPAGIRSHAVDPDGALVHELVVAEGPASVHVLNPPSPAATSAFAVGEAIAERVLAGPWATTRSTPVPPTARRRMPAPDAATPSGSTAGTSANATAETNNEAATEPTAPATTAQTTGARESTVNVMASASALASATASVPAPPSIAPPPASPSPPPNAPPSIAPPNPEVRAAPERSGS
ncbi:MAG: L-2-hydroxyglutarate oxidase [Phycisphaerales bacterium]